MNTASFVTGLIGLALDCIGFYGLFRHFDSFFESLSFSDIKFLLRNFQRNLNVTPQKIMDELMESIDSPENKKKNKRKKMFFWCVVLGFIFQFASLIISAINNTANKASDTTSQHSSCNK